ncbi:alpha/beta-hydrolase family protein [Demequina sp. SYSU T00039]|uniref:Alpha/beta-hydrolase family protein n=1 Tax=Demequina lignilytica TaxID=3051663 RepID=A0AAW7M9H6_9MICO|nr:MULTISPECIES: alpha/beta-hydrolase family protein [unclassified Demequina]MDN4477663.1 alpha/beta-hydrolase family protein [Demequina sp. SYSU T00039-1]MDN4487986.1 alpha/beta-hydrolase family protein [Demequina sp. SYSU T00039]MDN4490426.1 alpha/beta-hydrolase family protein [Demequina sp. SYSU T00068]
MRALSLAGTATGLILAALSATPSLLPRLPYEQGVLTGVCFAIGYALGTALGVAITALVRVPPEGWVPRAAWIILGVAAVGGSVPLARLWARTQGDLAGAGGAPRPGVVDGLVALGVALMTAAALLAFGRGVTAVTRRLARRLAPGEEHWRWLGMPSAMVVVTVVIAAVVGAAIYGFGTYTEWSYQRYNASGGAEEPASEFRSAGPESALSWDLTGHEGRSILAGGPSAHDIGSLTKTEAEEPIRVYVGVDEPGGWDDHAAAAVSELDRLGAADRGAILVAATTGTGWLDRQAIDSFEYLLHGDTALVTMQYSVAESWQSYTFHPGAYRDSTSALLDAVHDWWAAVPEADRPELFVYGLSLGSRAVQDSFEDAEALRAYGDGVVLAGTPYGTAMNAELTASRDAGSPVGRPVLDDGIAFRWFNEGIDLAEAGGPWERPRVAFLQHGKDPIVWAGLPILWSQPEWLEDGQRNDGIHPDMQWFPLVTGLQTMVDSMQDLAGPDGDGHRYGSTTLEAWIQVVGDGGYTSDQLDLIRQRVAGSDAPAGGDV